jgi:hypothetical protein
LFCNCPGPDDLVQGLCAEAKARFFAETGLTGKVEIELRIPDDPPPSFVVGVTVTDKMTGQQRSHDVVVRATPAKRQERSWRGVLSPGEAERNRPTEEGD